MMTANSYCRSSATADLANNTNTPTVAAVLAAVVGSYTAEQLVGSAAVPVVVFATAAAVPSSMTGNPTTAAVAVAPKEEEGARRFLGRRRQGHPRTLIAITLAISVCS
jgi:hypothetical protein